MNDCEMKNIKLIATALSLFTLFSCGDFMDTTPKGIVIPKTVEDFAGLTRDVTVATSAYPLADFSCDNLIMPTEFVSSSINSATGKAHFWQKDFFRIDEDDTSWNKLYNNIYRMNVVIENILSATEGTAEDKSRIMAEAKVNRAYCYWILVNMYAKAYDPASASSDLGVPLLLKPDLEAKLSRASVQTVINQVIADLDGAEKVLPEKSANLFLPSKASVYALRARVFFYMAQYDKAAAEAEKALAFNHEIRDMRNWSFKSPTNPWLGITGVPLDNQATDILFYRASDFAGAIQRMFAIDPDFLATFSPNDLRYKFFYSPIQPSGKETFKDGTSRCLQGLSYSITVSEMLLIKAEALARNKNMEALNIVNEIRKYRFTPENYVPLTATSESLLNVVLSERRLELQMSGLRWFDMKRLAKEGLYTKTLKRSLGTTEYVLKPNSDLYVFPIPPKELVYNINMVDNPR